MIIDQIENLYSGKENTERTINGSASYRISKSGHLLVCNPVFRLRRSPVSTLAGRGSVGKFSARSASRMRKYLRETLAEYSVLITLTYPAGHGFNGTESKRHLALFLRRLKRYAERMDGNVHTYGSFWFMEFQNRGAIHYHIFTTRRFPRQWISSIWYEIVGSEDDRHLHAGTRIESIRSGKRGISAYAAKYAAKQQQKIVPEDFGFSGRWWGVSGYKSTMSADTIIDDSHMGYSCVRRAINKLENTIRQMDREGKVRICRHESGALLIYIRALSAEARITWCVDAIESAIRVYDPRIRPSMFEELLRNSHVDIEDADQVLQQTEPKAA